MPVRIGPGQTAFTVTPAGAELDGECAREPDHAVLRGGVGADEGGRAEALGRGDVHDAPLAVSAQIVEAGAHAARVRRQIHGERGLPGRLEVRRRRSAHASTMPALFTRMSIGPSAARASAITAAMRAASETSSAKARAVPPAAPNLVADARGARGVAVDARRRARPRARTDGRSRARSHSRPR